MIGCIRCWACMLGQCPGGPHDWADQDDIDGMVNLGLTDPTGAPCGCPCVTGPSLGPEPGPDDIDLESIDGPACTVCGETTACAYDAEGRALIHTTDDEDQT